MYSYLKEDYRQMKAKDGSFAKLLLQVLFNAGFRAVFLYRIGRSLRLKRVKIGAVLCEKLMHHTCHCWISTNAEIGPGFVIRHVGTIVIGSNVVAGRNLDIRQGITIGGNMGKRSSDGRTQPKLGDNVLIGAGAVVVGPIEIGNNCVIGANSVVTQSFNNNSVIAGIPGVIIKRNN